MLTVLKPRGRARVHDQRAFSPRLEALETRLLPGGLFAALFAEESFPTLEEGAHEAAAAGHSTRHSMAARTSEVHPVFDEFTVADKEPSGGSAVRTIESGGQSLQATARAAGELWLALLAGRAAEAPLPPRLDAPPARFLAGPTSAGSLPNRSTSAGASAFPLLAARPVPLLAGTPLAAPRADVTVRTGQIEVRPTRSPLMTTQACDDAPVRGAHYSTFRGESGFDESVALAVDSAGTAFVAGTTERTDGSGILDAFVTRVSPEGRCTTIRFASENGSNILGRSVETPEDPPIPIDFYFWVELDEGVWELVCVPDKGDAVAALISSPFGMLDGGALTLDDQTGHVYAAGWIDYHEGGRDTWAIKFDQDITQPPLYEAVLHFTVDDVDVDSGGNSLTVDHEGNAYLAATVATRFGNENLTFRLDADGLTVPWAALFRSDPPTRGPDGGMFGIVVQGDSVYATGILTSQAPNRVDHLLAHWQRDGTLVWAFGWMIPDSSFAGRSLAVDQDGHPYTTGWFAGAGEDEQVHVVKFGPGGEVILDGTLLGAGGAERGLGLALGSSAADTDVYVTGWTESPNFTPILNACQPRYAGNRDGFLSRLQQPLG